MPAGVHDVIGRLWAEKAKLILGTIVIDNRGGGGGLIGANDVAHAAPDGYSILLGSTTTHVLLTPVMAKPPYDPVKSFSAIAVFAYSSTSIVINPSVPAQALAEFIAHAKANPGRLSYGSAGNGSITISPASSSSTGRRARIVHVPYKGIGQGVTDLISGQIPMLSANATAQILELHRAGKVRILAVNAPTRLKTASDIPTSIEAGLPEMVAQTTFGLFAPVGTPQDIVERINAVTQQVMADESSRASSSGSASSRCAMSVPTRPRAYSRTSSRAGRRSSRRAARSPSEDRQLLEKPGLWLRANQTATMRM